MSQQAQGSFVTGINPIWKSLLRLAPKLALTSKFGLTQLTHRRKTHEQAQHGSSRAIIA
jgi:hypothetical protein